jgi:ATP-dependent DNA helicase RecQ
MLGPNARPILKGEASVALREAPPPSRRRERSQSTAPAEHTPLFEALRQVRRELAAASGVPPYVVFHDATLRAMAGERPQSLEALGRISGVGVRKLEAYGNAFLEVLQAA